MLDIHTHILPEMDDGSRDIQQSIAMLRKEARQGIDRVVLTPHFYAEKESPQRFMERRAKSAQQLEEVAAGRRSLPKRYLGAEVAYFSGMSRVDGIEQLCIGDTRAMLIEMPFCRWNQHVLEEIDYLKECRGIRPIIAHVERYMRYQPLGRIRQLSESGVWIQTNASFFLRWQTSWMALHMLKQRQIHFIGSDCHDTKNRPPNMGAAILLIDRRLGKMAMRHIEQMESRLLEGE